MTDDDLRRLADKDRIADLITTLFVATDARDWPRVRHCFAPAVTFDMTSLVGGEVQHLTPDAIAAGWQSGLRPIEHLHHQIGNLAIVCNGAVATATCYGIAYHYRATRSGRNTRVFVGSYDFGLRTIDGAWAIDRFRFTVKFIDGNRTLETEPGAPEDLDM